MARKYLVAVTVILVSNCLPALADTSFVNGQLAQEKEERDQLEKALVPARRVRPDITLESVASDEPNVQAGFPPLPDRVDLRASGSDHIPYHSYQPVPVEYDLVPGRHVIRRLPVGDFDLLNTTPSRPARI